MWVSAEGRIRKTLALYRMDGHLYKVTRPMMTNAETLADLIHKHRGVKRVVSYLEGENNERVVAYDELYERALGILYHLQKLGAKPGDKLILYLSNNEQFLDAFWAGMLGGIVPVPVALGISDEHKHKLLRIARKLGKPFIYTDRKTLDRISAFAGGAGEQGTFDSLASRAFFAEQVDDISKAGQVHAVKPDDMAFIQFSSGSTSEPKGVVLTHRNILVNARGSGEAAHWGEADTCVSWMPLTHDMGLIGMHIMMFAHRMNNHIIPTELFIRRPLLWMTFCSRKQATITSSPNFGYRHYLKVLGDRDLGDLDLSRLRGVFNGAEPISVELAEEFMTRLAPAKLKRTAMYPVYGLAEATLSVSFPQPPGEMYSSIAVDRHTLNVGMAPASLPAEHDDALLPHGRGSGNSLLQSAGRRRCGSSRCPTATWATSRSPATTSPKAISKIPTPTPRTSRPTAGCAPAISE